MSIETEINRISTNVSNTLSAVSEMGGEVPEGATSDDMASGVRSIPVGAKIDDTTPSTTTTYSSSKIESEISKLNEANAAQNTEIAKKANDAELAPVSKSGSYTDLTDKPTIPTVPTTLPNPNKLILTGAVTAEYDGSAEVSVEIPDGGGGASGERIAEIEVTEEVSVIDIPLNKNYKNIIVQIHRIGTASNASEKGMYFTLQSTGGGVLNLPVDKYFGSGTWGDRWVIQVSGYDKLWAAHAYANTAQSTPGGEVYNLSAKGSAVSRMTNEATVTAIKMVGYSAYFGIGTKIIVEGVA